MPEAKTPSFPHQRAIEYASVTEAPGLLASREQIARLYQRYRFSCEYARGRDVLEVACGTGIGLGLLAEFARSVVGVDIDENNLSVARKTYESSAIELMEMDAHRLDFDDASFDLVVFFEAIYYLKSPEKFIAEAKRVLRESGRLVICTVNPDWQDFHASPFAEKYLNAAQLRDLLAVEFEQVELLGAFPVAPDGLRERFLSVIKRAAVSLDLIPGSLRARAYLKRLFFGPLFPLPERLSLDMTPYEAPVPIDPKMTDSSHKILYAVAIK